MKFFIATDYVSSRTIIIAVDAVEAIHEITQEEYNSHFQTVAEENNLGTCTLVRIRGGGVYYINNGMDEIISFLTGVNNG